MRKGQTQSISDVLDALAGRLGIRKQLKRAQVINEWADIVGERIAKETRPDRIKGAVLFVACSGSVWAQELTFLKPEIIKKIRERVGPGIVADIRFRTGQL
ncbi:MAG: DUF721 domain-containing protein [Actinomycetota bacterium]